MMEYLTAVVTFMLVLCIVIGIGVLTTVLVLLVKKVHDYFYDKGYKIIAFLSTVFLINLLAVIAITTLTRLFGY